MRSVPPTKTRISNATADGKPQSAPKEVSASGGSEPEGRGSSS